jgi:hypothetical protein
MIHELDIEIGEIECTVRLYNWTPYKPAYITGAPEKCYEAEGGYGDWALFVDGQRAEWLEQKLTERQAQDIEEKLFYMMEES